MYPWIDSGKMKQLNNIMPNNAVTIASPIYFSV